MAAKFKRKLKNVVYNYTDAEVKVREATSNDPWGPSSTLMRELAEYTFHIEAYTLVMGMLWKRLNDHGKNWRHVYKALVVLDYLVKAGSLRVVAQSKVNIFSVETLKDFQFLDKDGNDQGTAVREKARALTSLLKDDDLLQDERQKAIQSRERQTVPRFGSDSPQLVQLRDEFDERSGKKSPHPSPTTDRQGGSKVHFEPHVEEARLSANDEEELQLQPALKMSKEQVHEDEKLRHLAHFGCDPSTGAFDSSNINPEWRKLLDTVRETKEQLKGKETAYDFVEKRGGIEKATQELEKQPNKLPPPPSGRHQKQRGGRRAPPPPPRDGPPPPLSHGGNVPAPPPPPPIGVPAPPVSSGGSGGSRGSSKPLPCVDDARSNLLPSIRQGKQLKSVSAAEPEEDEHENDPELDGMAAGAVQRALALQQNAIHGSDFDNDKGNEDEDDPTAAVIYRPPVNVRKASSDLFNNQGGATLLDCREKGSDTIQLSNS